MHPFEVIRRPMITEKSTLLQEQGKYVFEVSPGATKTQVKQAVEDIFDVEVVAVNTMNIKGKAKRFGPRMAMGKSRKKAIVSLKPGDKIEIFSGA